MRALLAVAAILVAGCASPAAPAPEPVWVGPPEGTSHAPCASPSARELAWPGLQAAATRGDEGRGEGIHRIDDATILWVWRSYVETLREDRVSRIDAVRVHREADGRLVLCARVDLATPVFVDDNAEETYAVGVRIVARGGFGDDPMRVVVNWVAGCSPCEPSPRGNATAVFA